MWRDAAQHFGARQAQAVEQEQQEDRPVRHRLRDRAVLAGDRQHRGEHDRQREQAHERVDPSGDPGERHRRALPAARGAVQRR